MAVIEIPTQKGGNSLLKICFLCEWFMLSSFGKLWILILPCPTMPEKVFSALRANSIGALTLVMIGLNSRVHYFFCVSCDRYVQTCHSLNSVEQCSK